jgi:hypothetical protein
MHEVGRCPATLAWDVAVSGNYAYVAQVSAGFGIIDISDAQNPIEVGHCETPGQAYGVAVSGSYAYVAEDAVGLRIIDVSNPTSPVEVGHCDTPGTAWCVAVSGNLAYVADNGSVRVIDVTDLANPTEVGFHDTQGSAVLGAAYVGGYIYVAESRDGLQIYQFYGTGVTESPRPQASSRKLAATVLSGASGVKRLASCVVFDAMGRRVLNPRSGVLFVREPSAVGGRPSAVSKVIVQHWAG